MTWWSGFVTGACVGWLVMIIAPAALLTWVADKEGKR